MKSYRLQNNLIGWAVWLIATIVLVATAEQSASWWDCGEYIATSAKLMVGHPPGAPTFQILGSIAALFVGRDPALMGHAVNILSALCSSFSVLFLFWTITMITKKLIFFISSKQAPQAHTGKHASTFNPDKLSRIFIFAAGIIGALAYTFSDSFWFSAVEGEVYAMSAFFTAITFWAILKWDYAADESHNLRWIIFIAFLIGLAIGVHLLNLLVIPAIVFIIYYRKFKTSRKNFWMAMLYSLILLAGTLWGVIPWTVKLAGYFELFFVNVLRLPFFSGTIFYIVFLIAALIGGLIYSTRKQKVGLNTALLCLSFILIGYSTFVTLVIRANADVPINQGENKNAISLLAYLNRDQYGATPLFYGQYFNAPMQSVESVNPQYARNEEEKRYEPAGYSSQKVTYDPNYCGVFPRIWSSMESGNRPCITYNKIWSGCSDSGKPTLGQNLRFFLRYQINWMYMRYFMWNFVGRQNDLMGRGYNTDGSRDVLQGNWISGIKFIDEMRLGPQSNLPDYLAKNPARNTFFFLPLILGLCGLLWQYKNDRRSSFVVFLLFFMTGVAIAIYLNQPSTEPRERDYAFAGSFYAFAIWIGIGAAAVAHYLSGLVKNSKGLKYLVAICSAVVCTAAVPGLMAQQGWDDHDRSMRTSARDFGRNILESCEPNAVLVSDGDNDTFPLWFCQQVEGIRTDIKLINSMLANSSWLIQPLFRQVYESAPLKFTLPNTEYTNDKNDLVFIQEQLQGSFPAEQLLSFVASGKPETKVRAQSGEIYNYMPTRNLYLSLSKDEYSTGKAFTSEEISIIPDKLSWSLQGNSLTKSNLAILDIVVNNLATRPIYFISPYAHQTYLPLEQNQVEGMVYRFVPFKNGNNSFLNDRTNGMNTERTYDLLVNRFEWGAINSGKMKPDPETRAWSMQARQQYALLATALAAEGKTEKAVETLDKGIEFFPNFAIAFEADMLRYMTLYFQLGQTEKGEKLGLELIDIFKKRLLYAEQFPSRFHRSVERERMMSLQILQYIREDASRFNSTELKKTAESILQGRIGSI